jgi:hypothetical protein
MASESMDPKSIVFYLHMKGWTARAIHDNLVAILGEKLTAYDTVTWYLREARINSAKTISLHLDESNEAILRLLKSFHPLLFNSTAPS